MKNRLRDRLRRGVGSSPAPVEPDPPCIPCGEQAAMRQFSFNPPPVVVADGDVPRPAPAVDDTVFDDRVVVQHTDTSVNHVLNASAALIWLSLDGRTTVADLIDDLHRETGVARDVLDRDVRETVARFVESGIATLDAPVDEASPVAPR